MFCSGEKGSFVNFNTDSSFQSVIQGIFLRHVVGGNQDYHMSLVVRKPVFGVSDQVRHKLGCAVTEYGLRLEISYLESRGIVLSV